MSNAETYPFFGAATVSAVGLALDSDVPGRTRPSLAGVGAVQLQGTGAQFAPAYKLVQKHEGGYANQSYDKGGETYRGIARNIWPTWSGWPIVDRLKRRMGGEPSNNHFWDDAELDAKVEDFYRQRWNQSKAGLIQDQRVANVYYDFYILASYAPQLLKRVLRTLGQRNLDDSNVPNNAMVAAANQVDADKLVNAYVEARIAYHQQRVARDPTQQKFMDGWTKRALAFKLSGRKVWPYLVGGGVLIGTTIVVWHLVKSRQKSEHS